jgi:hypothetical protein
MTQALYAHMNKKKKKKSRRAQVLTTEAKQCKRTSLHGKKLWEPE